MAFLENPLADKNLQAKLDFLKEKTTTDGPTEEVLVPKTPMGRFEEVYRKHKEELVLFAKKKFSLNGQEVEDAVQEAFMALLKHIDNVTPGKEVFWLKTTISNKLKRYYATRLNRLRILTESFIPEKHRELMPKTTVDHLVAEEEVDSELKNLEKLRKSIELLPPRFKEIVELFYLEGMSHGDIAQKLGIEASTSRSNLTKALVRLREIYLG